VIHHEVSPPKEPAMNRQRRFRRVFVYAAAALLAASGAHAQQPSQQTPASNAAAPRKAALKKFVDAANQLSPEVRKHLSSGLKTYLLYANAAVNGTAAKPSADVARKTPWASGAGFAGGAIAVSDPVLDPRSEGYTQNTTSSAWCGNSIVVGYQDTGASFRTDPSGQYAIPYSLDGVSFSSDAGARFIDIGFLT